MKYVEEFRDGKVARALAAMIAREVDPARSYALMEFCGGHTHAIARYGLEDLLPPQVHMVHGPGCPVCVLPMGRIDDAIALARRPEVILASYGDTLRVPGSDRTSLLAAKAAGAAVHMLYSPQEALTLAREHPDRQVVFFAIGFETTAPATALTIQKAHAQGLPNFSVFCNHVLTPPAIRHILDVPADAAPVRLDGFLGPAHVSAVIGSDAYVPFAAEFQRPVVITGFEPLDVMQAVLMLVRQLNEGRAEVENQYTRAVTPQGNLKARGMLEDVFELRADFEWRGLGVLPHSAMQLRSRYADLDAERRFAIQTRRVPDHPACACGTILRGQARPTDCKLFGKVCTPEHPMGSCMVSSEGACAAQFSYGRFRGGVA